MREVQSPFPDCALGTARSRKLSRFLPSPAGSARPAETCILQPDVREQSIQILADFVAPARFETVAALRGGGRRHNLVACPQGSLGGAGCQSGAVANAWMPEFRVGILTTACSCSRWQVLGLQLHMDEFAGVQIDIPNRTLSVGGDRGHLVLHEGRFHTTHRVRDGNGR